MVSQFRCGRMVASLLIGLMLVSCGSDSSPAAPTPPPAGTSAALVQRIEVTGPDSIAPGESAQLTATAFKSDGSTENVSPTVAWLTSNSRVIQIAAGGRASAVSQGEATITARFQNRSGMKLVLALQPSTYKVSGRITEGTVALQGVSLRVIRGTGEGLTTTSDFNGRFTFFGLAGDVRIQASKQGYIDAFRDLSVNSIMTDNFELAPARQRKNLAGTYSLTVAASPCFGSGQIPDEIRSRRYTASITQDGRALNVALSGADFIVASGRGDHFSGTIDPADNVTFSLGDSYYYYFYSTTPFDLVERLDDSRSFTVAGFVTATMRGSEIAGTLSGSFLVLRGTRPPFTQVMSTCFSQTHTFVMQPR